MSTSLEGMTPEQIYGLAQLANTLANDPSTRENFLGLVKKGNPNLAIPEIDAKNEVLAQLQEERKAREALELKIQEREIRESIERKKAEVQSKFSFSQSDMDEIEKIMLDEQIPNYETAAKYLKASRSVAERSYNPATSASQVKLPDSDVWAKGFGNQTALNNIAREQAYQAMNEILGSK